MIITEKKVNIIIVENIVSEIKLFIYKIYTNIWIKAIRVGLITIQPMILVGCILSIIISIPCDVFKQFMGKIFTDKWSMILMEINSEIYTITKVLIVISITYSFVSIYKRSKLKDTNINMILVTIVGLISAFVLTYNYRIGFRDNITASWSFISAIISIIFSNIYIYIYIKLDILVKFLKNRLSINTANLIRDIINLLFIVSLLLIIRKFITSNEIISNYKVYLSQEYNLLNIVKYLFYTQVGWFLSGHGNDMMGALIFDNSYVNIFSNIGGTGSTIAIIIGVIFVKTHKYTKNTAKVSIIPAMFNINEIALFGMPVILNPIYLIPFIITPIVLIIITTIALNIGFISIEQTSINYITPIILNSYMATGSINGIILQIINIIVAVFIYIPFIKLDSKVQKKERNLAYNKLKNEILKKEYSNLELNKLEWNVKEIYEYLSEDLYKSIYKNNNLYIEYQPQVNKSGKVVGVEALLRWKNEEFGNIPPNVAIIIAEKSGIIDELGYWIVNKSCEQLEIINKTLCEDIELSINVSAIQFEDEYFAKKIKSIIDKYNIRYSCIKLEITETTQLKDDKITQSHMNDISKTGIKIVLDDIGVGYSPINYIKKYKISCIKIDRVLISDIHVSSESRRIVESLYRICESYGMDIISEFVETDEQKKVLDEMGEGLYQGYLFSKPLELDECISYIKEVGFASK